MTTIYFPTKFFCAENQSTMTMSLTHKDFANIAKAANSTEQSVKVQLQGYKATKTSVIVKREYMELEYANLVYVYNLERSF